MEHASVLSCLRAAIVCGSEHPASASGAARGAYILAGAADAEPQVVLIASGSELALAVAAHEQLAGEGVRSRVVSMPSWEIFEAAVG